MEEIRSDLIVIEGGVLSAGDVSVALGDISNVKRKVVFELRTFAVMSVGLIVASAIVISLRVFALISLGALPTALLAAAMGLLLIKFIRYRLQLQMASGTIYSITDMGPSFLNRLMNSIQKAKSSPGNGMAIRADRTTRTIESAAG